jgi:hypothetical protein
MRITSATDEDIRSVEDWHRLCPPKKRAAHWVDGRSAKELAKAWFRKGVGAVPEELAGLLGSHETTRDLVVESATPECQTSLDKFPGETRNHDVVLFGHAGTRQVVIGLESKADEPFDRVLGEYYDMKKGTSSNVPRRIEQLVGALFASRGAVEWRGLRYQLVHGCAATLIEAKLRHADVAVLVVHEFLIPGATKPENVERNARTGWPSCMPWIRPGTDCGRASCLAPLGFLAAAGCQLRCRSWSER